MQKLILLLLIIQGIFFLSCDRYVGRYDSFKIDLDTAKSHFPKELIEHFPDRMTLPAGYIQGFESDENNVSLILEQEYEDNILDTIQDYFQYRALAVYPADESCLFVVNRFAHNSSKGVMYNRYNSEMERPASCSDDYLPVPNFWEKTKATLTTPSRLPKDFTIYVLEANKATIGKELNSRWERWMPDDWKNGYSKGIAINKNSKEVLYWTIMW